jgi:3-oxoacyl-[acyl-carrier protein] reductase
MVTVQTIEGLAASSGLNSPARAKVAIVTGASRGIGRGIAERLIETGYCVVANSRNITLAKTLQRGDRLKLVDGDIGSHNVAKQVVESAILDYGRIDLLVNNAGCLSPSPLPNTLPKTFNEPLKLISGDSSTSRNLRHRRCAFRNLGTSSTSRLRLWISQSRELRRVMSI